MLLLIVVDLPAFAKSQVWSKATASIILRSFYDKLENLQQFSRHDPMLSFQNGTKDPATPDTSVASAAAATPAVTVSTAAPAENVTAASNARAVISDENPTSQSQVFGRMKSPPKCDPSLKKDAKTTEELSKYTFTPGMPVTLAFAKEESSPVTPIPESSSSSACSTENGNGCEKVPASQAEKQGKLNRKILLRTESRQGRESQRWSMEAETHQRVRLVTGCVPILKDGRILFVSASRKAEWILPKGGWEQDETLEESAVRETYEEAGVLGTLGPELAPIQYETRKSKKRRKEMIELLRKSNTADDGAFDESKPPLHTIASPSTDGSPEPGAPNAMPKVTLVCHSSILSDAVVNRIRESKPKMRSDETSSCASNASDSSTYSLVKMTLFPLYVSEIRDTWPESGRFRKIVDIDEAIEMLESRDELRLALIQVKERRLHLVYETPATVVQKEAED